MNHPQFKLVDVFQAYTEGTQAHCGLLPSCQGKQGWLIYISKSAMVLAAAKRQDFESKTYSISVFWSHPLKSTSPVVTQLEIYRTPSINKLPKDIPVTNSTISASRTLVLEWVEVIAFTIKSQQSSYIHQFEQSQIVILSEDTSLQQQQQHMLQFASVDCHTLYTCLADALSKYKTWQHSNQLLTFCKSFFYCMIPDCYSTMGCVQSSHFHSEGRELCSATSMSVTTEP